MFCAFHQGCKIRTLPPILTFSLLRFDYDFQRGERFKVNTSFITILLCSRILLRWLRVLVKDFKSGSPNFCFLNSFISRSPSKFFSLFP